MSVLSLEQARACIARGVKRAQELGFRVAIAVVEAATWWPASVWTEPCG